MPIGVAVGVVSAILFVARVGNVGDNSGLSCITGDALEELDEDIDGEGGAVKEGFREEFDDEPEGLNRESPESFCSGGSVPIDDSSPEPASDSTDEPGISRKKDEFKL